jgi:hypothetical protein
MKQTAIERRTRNKVGVEEIAVVVGISRTRKPLFYQYTFRFYMAMAIDWCIALTVNEQQLYNEVIKERK